MPNSPETRMRLIYAAVAAALGVGGSAGVPWGLDELRNQSSVSVTFSGQARSALTLRDANGQPVVTEQDYSRACMRAIDTEARTKIADFVIKQPAAD